MKLFEISFCKEESSIPDNENCINENFTIDYQYYKDIYQKDLGLKSNPYIFKPLTPNAYEMSSPINMSITKGDLVTEIRVI